MINTVQQAENVPGPFFVDSNCIACDTCTNIASDYFTLTEDYDHAFLYKQPTHPVEIERCHKALQSCPVAAINFKDTE
ncbi:ferredoxin [Candidatus Marinamargulisbacteria bacterium SCGC AG-439-L15]|nr:ferredoxin [Candidatus Marinamargulisbacteria bacterium SCGC AG-439-L15]